VLGSKPVAYFSAEFGMHESVPIYSGGLGVLSGDHVKSASDLGIPLIAIGLFYDQGYFKQRLDHDGYQIEEYLDTKVENCRWSRPWAQRQADQLEHRNAHGVLHAKVWLMHVGRVQLYLLDCDVDGNSPEDRELTSRLYGGDHRTRIRQELVLGVGGVKRSAPLGIKPGVYHLNEGHSAFRHARSHSRMMEEDGLSFDDAMRDVAAHTVFTTHTPVPAGHDRFDGGLIEEHLGPLRDQARHLVRTTDGPRPRRAAQRRRNVLHDRHRAQALAARQRRERACTATSPPDVGPPLAVARRRRNSDRPHHQRRPRSDVARLPDAAALRSQLPGPTGMGRMGEPKCGRRSHNVDPGELWETHQRAQEPAAGVRPPPREPRVRAAATSDRRSVEAARNMLDPNVLTIGFARRFATYKRADLIPREPTSSDGRPARTIRTAPCS
jgi:starch phosphorylase